MARLLVNWFFYFIFFAQCLILLLTREPGLLFVALQCKVALQRYYAGFVFRSKKEGMCEMKWNVVTRKHVYSRSIRLTPSLYRFVSLCSTHSVPTNKKLPWRRNGVRNHLDKKAFEQDRYIYMILLTHYDIIILSVYFLKEVSKFYVNII